MAELCVIDQDQIIKIQSNETEGCKIEIDGVPIYFDPNQFEGIEGDIEPLVDIDTTEFDDEREEFINKISRCKNQTDEVINQIDKLRKKYTNVRIALWRLIELRDNANPVYLYHKRRFEKYSELIQVFTEHYNKRIDKQSEIDSNQFELDDFLNYYNGLISPSQSDTETLNTLNQNLQTSNQEMAVIISDYTNDLKNLIYYLNSNDVEQILNTSISELSEDIHTYANALNIQSNNYSSALVVSFNNYFNGLLNMLNNVNIFSSTINIKIIEDITNNPEIIDDSYLIPSNNAEMYFNGIDQDEIVTGKLYTQYYDLLNDPINNLFTLNERGLSTSPNDIDPNLQRDATEGGIKFNIDVSDMTKYIYNDETFYIKNKSVFESFFTNFADKLEAKLEWMRLHVVKPMLDEISDAYISLADREARYYTANSLVNNFEMEDMISRSEEVVIKYNALNSEIDRLTQLQTDLKEQMSPESIALKMKEEVECVTTVPGNQEPPNDNGRGLTTSYGRFNPDTGELEDMPDKTKPNSAKYCYWNKFAELATIYGLLPFPDPLPTAPGIGMRYWPVGFTIPSPAGLIKIPLPMIWLPLFVLSSPFGTAVLFLNVCGIFPSPMLFFIANQGSKKLILTLRGPSNEIGCSAKFGGVTSNILKPLALSSDVEIRKAADVMDSSQSLDDFKNELISKILQKVDGWGIPELNKVNELKNKSKNSEDFDLGEISRAIKEDAVDFLANVTLPNITIPKDAAKVGQGNAFDKVLDIGKLFSGEEFKINQAKSLDLKEKMRLYALDLYQDPELNDMASNMPTLDLTTNEGVGRFQTFMTKFFEKLTEILTQSNLFLSIASIADSYRINTFICQEAIAVPNNTDLPKTVVISHMAAIASNALANISSVELVKLFGFSKLQPKQIFSAALMFISNFIPPIPLPPDDFDFKFGSLFKNIALSLAQTLIPRISLPLELPSQININLNDYMAGITNMVDRTLERYVNLLPSGSYGDPKQFLTGISGIDIKVLINYIIGAHIEPVLDPILKIAQGFMSIPAFRGFEINQLDIVMDPTSIWSKFQEMLGADMNLSKHIPLFSPDLVSEAMKLLKNLEAIPWPVIGALSAYGNSEIIRELHPIMRCDDIPPWERLTLDNILFVVFLDDFCHNGKIKGGMMENFYP